MSQNGTPTFYFCSATFFLTITTMTYGELLHKVAFEEILPYVERYNDYCPAQYKCHYDMLCHEEPYNDSSNEPIIISNSAEEDMVLHFGHYLQSAIDNGYGWNYALGQEIIIEPDVNASLAEIAACCLANTLLAVDYDNMKIEKALSSFDKMPLDKKLQKLREIDESIAFPYTDNLCKIFEFCIAALPIDGKTLRILASAKEMKTYVYRSHTYGEKKRADWMIEIIDKYNAFEWGTLPNCVVCLVANSELFLREKDMQVAQYICSMCSGEKRIITRINLADSGLGLDMRLAVAFYE